MTRVAVLDDYQRVAAELADWASLPDTQVDFFHDSIKDEGRLIERLQPYDAVVLIRERTPLPAPVLDALPNLKLIAATGRRQPHIDLEAANRLGIVVCTTASGSDSTAELAWGLIFALTRHITWEDRQLRQGLWQTRLGEGVRGKTLGVFGLGRLGTTVAKIGQVFGMHVIAWSPSLTPERAQAAGATCVTKGRLFVEADIVTIHAVLNGGSRGSIGKPELGLMKPTAYLVNTSRGPIVQQDALIDALHNRTIAGAAVDVYDEEPLPADHPFLVLDNIVLTPHVGYVTRENLGVLFGESVENIRAWLTGAPQNVLNPEAIAREPAAYERRPDM